MAGGSKIGSGVLRKQQAPPNAGRVTSGQRKPLPEVTSPKKVVAKNQMMN